MRRDLFAAALAVIIFYMKKIAVITGASSGMGRDFALLLNNFFKVDEIWLMARRKERLILLAEEMQSHGNMPKARIIEADISGKSGVNMFAELLEAESKNSGDFEISLLINNAGFGTYGTFEETPLDTELNMIELNCISLTGFCGIALKYMKSGAHIINAASLAAFLPLGNFAVYGATKAFVLSFSTALAAELKPRGISVCALCPGPVSTEFANIASGGARKEVLHGLSSRKVVEHCLKKASKGKYIAIMAFKWKFKAFMSRFIGKYAGADFTFKYCKRPHN